MAKKQTKKRRISKQESAKLAPTLKKFNGLAKQFADLLGIQVEQKKSRINVMVSQTAMPVSQKHGVNIVNMDVSKNFLKEQRQKGSGGSPFRSPWNSDFSKKKGSII